MQYFRKWCDERRILHSKQVMRARERAVIETAGMVVIIQAPETAKEIRFITLEDEFELINVVVFPDLYHRVRKIIRGERFLWFTGVVEREETVTTLRASGVRALPLDAPSLPSLPRWRSSGGPSITTPDPQLRIQGAISSGSETSTRRI